MSGAHRGYTPGMDLAPTLTTERLLLRGHRAADLDDCAALWQDPEVTRYTTGQPVARQDVWTRLLRHPGHWGLLGFGYWLAFEKASGRFVGEVGLARFERDFLAGQPDLGALPEAGWVTLPWAHGQGFASEAMTAVLAWQDRQGRWPRSFCIIHPDNAPSLRLAGKLGFRPERGARRGEATWQILLRDTPGHAPA